MRCRFCGSKAIYPYKNHEQAGAGRVIAGAIIAGPIGAVAGLAGKNVKGYRCSACGMFSELPMDSGEEALLNYEVNNARNGNTRIYERYKEKYANLEFVPVRHEVKQELCQLPVEHYENASVQLHVAEQIEQSVKHSYSLNQYIVGSPIFISNITIKDDNGTDVLLLEINNISNKTLRSVYLHVTVYDDVGDQISTNTFALQGLSAATGETLPQAKPFNLNTNVAYKVEVLCEKAAFADDTVWRSEENPTIYSVPEKTELVPESFAQYKYLQVLLTKKGALRTGQKLYYPVVEETHRLCICGNPVVNGNKCPVCGLDEANLQEVMDYDVLIQCRRDLIVKTATERTASLSALYHQAQEDKYQEALQFQQKENFVAAAGMFISLAGYKDSQKRAEQCETQAEECKKQRIYDNGMTLMSKRFPRIEDYKHAIVEFNKISGWKDADAQIEICQKKIEEIVIKEEADRIERERKAEIVRAAEEKRKKRNIAIGIIASLFTIILITTLILLDTFVWTPNQYNAAIELYNSGKYTEAVKEFSDLGTYEDSENWVKKSKYEYIQRNKNNTDTTTYEYLESLKQEGYRDCVSIYDKLYVWNVEIVINKSETDTKSNTVSIAKPGDRIYVHVNVSGGYPGGSKNFVTKYYLPNYNDSPQSLLRSTYHSGGESHCAWIQLGTESSFICFWVYDENGNIVAEAEVDIDR